MARLLPALILAGLLVGCEVGPSGPTGAAPDSTMSDTTGGPFIHASSDVEAGRYLVEVGGCNDCHTVGFMERGMAVPEAEWLTGSPIGFLGPWGTSYPANLRLKAQEYSEDVWVQTLHTRTALPPMPWPSVNAMSERDTRALYRYIRSLGPAGQPAPTPLPPGQAPATPYFDFEPKFMERLGAPQGAPGTPPATPPAPSDSAAAPSTVG